MRFLFLTFFSICILIESLNAEDLPDAIWQVPLSTYYLNMKISDDYSLCIVTDIWKFNLYDLNKKKLVSTIDYTYKSNAIFKRAYFTCKNNIVITESHSIYLFNIENNAKTMIIDKEHFPPNHNSHIPVSINPKIDEFAFAAEDCKIYFFDVNTLRINDSLIINDCSGGNYITTLTYSLDGKKVIVITGLDYCYVIDKATKNIDRTIGHLYPNPPEIRDSRSVFIECINDSNFICTNITDSLSFWNYKTGLKFDEKQISYTNSGHKVSIDKKYYSCESQYWFEPYRTLYFYDLNTWEKWEYKIKSDSYSNYVFYKDNQLLYKYDNGCIAFFDFKQSKIVDYLTVNNNPMLQFSSDGKYLYTIGDGICKIDASNGKIINFLDSTKEGYHLYVRDISKDSKYLACISETADNSKIWFVYNYETDSVIMKTEINNGSPFSVKFSNDGKLLACIYDMSYYIEVYEVETGTLIDYVQHSYPAENFSFSPNSEYLLYIIENPLDSATTDDLYIRNIKERETVCTVSVLKQLRSDYKFWENHEKIIGFPDDKSICIFDACSFNNITRFQLPTIIDLYKTTNDEKFLIVSSHNEMNDSNFLTFFYLTKESIKNEIAIKMKNGIIDAAVSLDNKLLAVSDDKQIYLYNFADIASAVEHNQIKHDFRLFPNPAHKGEIVNIQMNNEFMADINNLFVCNLLGSCFSVNSIINANNTLLFPTTDLSSGVYFLKFNSGDKIKVVPFVVIE